jgi:O-antigen/teichoic acid export membrane protein
LIVRELWFVAVRRTGTVAKVVRSGLVGRAGWSFADQAMSSLTNAALSIVLAKVAGAEGYGAFAVAFTVFTFLAGVSRALVNHPFLMRYPAVSDAAAQAGARSAGGLALLFGLGAAVLLAPVAVILGGASGASLGVTAALLPALLLQDVWRAVFIARGRARSAAANTALWTGLQFAGLAVAVTAGVRDPAALLGVWGVTGLVAAAVACVQGRAVPSPAGGVGYARAHRDIAGFLVAEWLTVLGAAQLALLLVGALGSAADVGSLRAAQTLLGPLTLLVVATFGFLVPELVRRPHLGARELRFVAGGVGVALTVVTLLCGSVLAALPDHIGAVILGEVWPGARATLLAMTLWMIGATLAVGPLTVIRACGQARASFGVNVLIGLLLVTCVPIGFVLGGAPGAAVGFAVANLAPAPLFWVRMEAVLRTSRSAHRDTAAQ